jgi:hypothetical protein
VNFTAPFFIVIEERITGVLKNGVMEWWSDGVMEELE